MNLLKLALLVASMILNTVPAFAESEQLRTMRELMNKEARIIGEYNSLLRQLAEHSFVKCMSGSDKAISPLETPADLFDHAKSIREFSNAIGQCHNENYDRLTKAQRAQAEKTEWDLLHLAMDYRSIASF